MRAIATVAGYSCYEQETDLESVDIGFASLGYQGSRRAAPRLEAQLKATSRDILLSAELAFPLKVKNHNELCGPGYLVPRILIVVVVPEGLDDWLQHSEDSLIMRHCGYWISLENAEETDNVDTVTVHIPRVQQFNVASLQRMMQDISQGHRP